MKFVITIATVCLLLVGCGNNGPAANSSAAKPVATSASTPVSANAPVNANSATPAPTPVTTGAKVAQPEVVTFEPGGFPSDWQWIDPDSKFSPSEHDTKNGVLAIRLPSGKDMFGETRTAPRLVKAISGNFEIETKVKFDPKDSYQGAGLIIFRNDNNYLRLERGFGGVGGGESGIRWDKREDEVYEPIVTPEKFPTTAGVVELKLKRVGSEITGYWREPGAEWKEVGKYSAGYPDAVLVGIIACNTAEPINVEFSSIKLTPVN